jgi:hypothetical protein
MMLRRFWLAALLCLAVASGSAQQPLPDTRADALIKNGLKLAGTLQMDRQAYLAGETMDFAVTVSNPTATSLEVLKPFDYGTGWFIGSKQRTDRNGVVRWISAQSDIVHAVADDAPSAVLQPGESVTHLYHFYDDLPGCLHIHYPLTAPQLAGMYRLQYAFGNWPTAEYLVVMPVLEEFVAVQVPKAGDAQESVGTYVFSLASGGQRFLCVRRQVTSGDDYRSRADLRLPPSGAVRSQVVQILAPYSRFAQSDTPFTSLAATADADSNLTITWIAPDPSNPGGTRPATLVLKKADWLVELPSEPGEESEDSE